MGPSVRWSIRPDGTTWYSCAVVRVGLPLLHAVEMVGPALRNDRSLLLKAEGLWAEHECESAFAQWTVANELYAVALEHPDDALGRAYGTPTAIAFDIEWYATTDAVVVEGGYTQTGTAHAVIELPDSPIDGEFVASRSHRWGVWTWGAAPRVEGLRAPVRFDRAVIDRVVTPSGWHQGQRPTD